jgi:endonuclease III
MLSSQEAMAVFNEACPDVLKALNDYQNKRQEALKTLLDEIEKLIGDGGYVSKRKVKQFKNKVQKFKDEFSENKDGGEGIFDTLFNS